MVKLINGQINPPAQSAWAKCCDTSWGQGGSCSCPVLWVEILLDLPWPQAAPHWATHNRKAPLLQNFPPLNILQSPHSCVCCVVTVGSFFSYFFSLTFVCPNKTLRTSHGHFHLFKDDQAGRKAGSAGDFVLVLPLSKSQLTEVTAPSRQGCWQLELANLSPRNPRVPNEDSKPWCQSASEMVHVAEPSLLKGKTNPDSL